jgi:hypothetical protein
MFVEFAARNGNAGLEAALKTKKQLVGHALAVCPHAI